MAVRAVPSPVAVMGPVLCFAFSSLPYTFRHYILDGLLSQQCVEFIQLFQAVERLRRIMEVERAVVSVRVFKNGEIPEIPLFSGLARNSWK